VKADLPLRIFGDIDDLGGGVVYVCGTGEPLRTRELRRSDPGGQAKQVKRVGGGGFVTALFAGVVVSELAENDGAHGGAFGRGAELPIKAETLTANATVDVFAELGSSE
jgi:hypothetical protein